MTDRENECVHVRGGWRFDKSISLGHVFTAVSVIGAVVVPLVIWAGTVETRFVDLQRRQDSLETTRVQSIEDIKQRIQREAQWRATEMADIKATLNRIESKVDQKLDREIYQPPTYTPPR